MAVRAPSQYSTDSLGGSGSALHGGMNPIDYEIAGEKAASLGRAGERVQKTLAILAGLEREAEDRRLTVRDAAEAVYAYFIQRELCGLRRHHDAIAEYGIPQEVLARLGAT